MKQDDLKAGELYAYKHDSYTESRCVRLISPVRVKSSFSRNGNGTVLTRAEKGDRVGRSRGYSNTSTVGYLVLRSRTAQGDTLIKDVDVDEVLKTVMDNQSTGAYKTDDLHVEIVNNSKLIGLWEDIDAGNSAKKALVKENNAKGRAWEAERTGRFLKAVTVIHEALGEAPRTVDGPRFDETYYSEKNDNVIGTYRSKGTITLTLEQMEKLVALLAE